MQTYSKQFARPRFAGFLFCERPGGEPKKGEPEGGEPSVGVTPWAGDPNGVNKASDGGAGWPGALGSDSVDKFWKFGLAKGCRALKVCNPLVDWANVWPGINSETEYDMGKIINAAKIGGKNDCMYIQNISIQRLAKKNPEAK